jgi:hypothetical protein
MDACASPPLQHDRTRLLLVDTDNLFLDDVGGALRANEGSPRGGDRSFD